MHASEHFKLTPSYKKVTLAHTNCVNNAVVAKTARFVHQLSVIQSEQKIGKRANGEKNATKRNIAEMYPLMLSQ